MVIRIWADSLNRLRDLQAYLRLKGIEPAPLKKCLGWATDRALSMYESDREIPTYPAEDRRLVAVDVFDGVVNQLERIAAYRTLKDNQYHWVTDTSHDVISYGLEVAKSEATRKDR